ncbi:metal-dependent hydrolase, partial [Streptomyces resistomycificus]
MSARIAPRRVSFDWSRTPLHWIPGEPTATHVINVLHLLLPAGERWFVQVFKQGLPLVEDPELLAQVKGFMGQEATHSVQHTHVLDHLGAQRLETAEFTRHVDFLFERLLGERPPLGAPIPEREWLRFRLAVVAAIEQFTAVLGDWFLAADGLDRAHADEVMLDLLRWHGAEEVEHRSVAFDMYQHCGGTGTPRYARRVAGMAVTAPVMLYLWVWGTAYLMRHDPQLTGSRLRYSYAEHNRAVHKGLLPAWR